MIKLNKGPTPEIIVQHGEAWTAVWVAHVNDGAPITDAEKRRYKHRDIKTAILEETSEKCAYCESKVTHTYPGDVEHILPKMQRPDLFVFWENLTFGCSICNNRKGDYYSEDEPLLNPYADNPQEHLMFHGPLVLHAPGSAAGELTVLRLELSRAPLFERRRERIQALKPLIDRWANQPDGTLKDLLLGEIERELAADREYSATLIAFAREHAGIEVDLEIDA